MDSDLECDMLRDELVFNYDGKKKAAREELFSTVVAMLTKEQLLGILRIAQHSD